MDAGIEPIEDTRPMIYVAGATADRKFINTLIETGQSYTGIDWWSPIKLRPGLEWASEIDRSIRRSVAAFFVLSRAFLKSASGIREMDAAIKKLGYETGSIYPILYEECDWRRHAFLLNPKIEILSLDHPLSEVPPEEWEAKLEGLFSSIKIPTTLLGSPSLSRSTRAGYRLSRSVTSILKRAERLAEVSSRGIITSSCLLFAIADDTNTMNGTADFLHALLNEKGLYKQVFDRFLKDGADSGTPVRLDGIAGLFSYNAQQIIREAWVIAQETNTGAVSTRHLAAAVLLTSGQVALRLAAMNVSVVIARQRFLSFAISVDRFNEAAWTRIMAPHDSLAKDPGGPHDKAENFSKAQQSTPFRNGMTGYTSEFCGMGITGVVSDYLGVHDYADRFASLIAARDTHMPLAIGLFGNWGSGKSHFMNLIDHRMHALANEEKSITPTGDLTGYCKSIVSIHFNAWHYSDTNLWASIISEIFDKLFSHYSSDQQDQVALLKDKLAGAGGVTTLALEESCLAERAVALAKSELARAEREKESLKEVLRGFKEGLRELVPEVDTEENRTKLFAALGISNGETTLEQLEEHNKEIRSLWGRSRDLVKRAFSRDGIALRFGWLLVFALAFLVSLELMKHLTYLKGKIQSIGPTMQVVLTVLMAFVGWLTPAIKQANATLRELEAWQGKAEKAQRALGESPRVIETKAHLARVEAAAKLASDALAQAQAKVDSIRAELQDALPQRRLTKFIESRANSAEYKGHLGLVSLARKDLAELSRIFTDTAKVGDSLIDNDCLERSLFDSIDRVVLYVDDLDRCAAETVVDVLQAVHLLLAYPLFAVIVGVDQRSLKRSLQVKFRSLMTNDEAPKRSPGEKSTDAEEVPTTPLDYLEKIFHIPFHLPPMAQDAFGNLIEKLSALPDPTVKPNFAENVPPAKLKSSIQLDLVSTFKADFQEGTANDSPLRVEPEESAGERSLGIHASIVPLERWEIDSLKQYHSLIRTPRGATRLLNTYRLVKSAVGSSEWQTFHGENGGRREFRLAMLFLAAAAGAPAVAREWFQRVRVSAITEKNLPVENGFTHANEWQQFRGLYEKLPDWMREKPTAERIEYWLNRVERYTF